MRISDYCSDSCFHHPTTQADTLLKALRTGRLSLLEPKADAKGRDCSESLPGTDISWTGDPAVPEM